MMAEKNAMYMRRKFDEEDATPFFHLIDWIDEQEE